MKVELSETASQLMLDALSQTLDGGSIELMSDNRVLAVLRLSNPAADVIGRILDFKDIAEEDAALAQGIAMTARIIASNGNEVFTCDVGDENSNAVIKLNTTKIYRGGPVRLSSFRLVMP